MVEVDRQQLEAMAWIALGEPLEQHSRDHVLLVHGWLTQRGKALHLGEEPIRAARLGHHPTFLAPALLGRHPNSSWTQRVAITSDAGVDPISLGH